MIAEFRAISVNQNVSLFRKLWSSDWLKIWWLALAIKIVIAVWLPFANDESYYWVWGHHPQLSYFDHPAMVGWLFYLGTFLERFGNAARLPGVFIGHLTLLIWIDLLSPYLEERRKKWWLLFLAVSPFLGLGSLILTPDIPFLFFWSLSLWILLRAVASRRALDYALLGLSLGLGFFSKYLIVLFIPCALLWLGVSGKWRRVDWKKLPLTIVIGLLFCAPVLIWNLQNHWASFAFQLTHGLESETRNAIWPLEYFGSQIGILFPIAVYFAVRRKSAPGTSFLQIFGWFPLAFFFYTSFRARVEGNWPMMGHPEILALAFLNANHSRWLRGQWVLWTTVTTLIFIQVLRPWIPVNEKKLKTYEFTHYDVFLPIAAERKDLYMGSYQEAAAVSYKMRRQIYKLAGMNRRDFYDFTPQSHPTGDSFVVGAERWQPLPPWVLEAGYEIVSERVISDEFKLIEVRRKRQ
jgi:4-amino-4-deoxy-L-arabinose transferase-like glycosyltransferase